ncbi:MAG: ATP-binding protein [Gemmatimonadales bacterium]
MTFRTRLTLSFGAIALIPLLVFGYGVQRRMTSRLDDETRRRVESRARSLRDDLAASVQGDRTRLRALAQDLAGSTQFRVAVSDTRERRWLLDWAGDAMRAGGLAMLQLQDSAGRILSSGHFRNDFDRVDAALPLVVAAAPNGAALVSARTPLGAIRVLAVVDSFTVGGRRFSIVGGRLLDSVRVAGMARDPDIGVALMFGDSARAADVVTRFPYVEDRAPQERALTMAYLVLLRDPGPGRELRRSVNLWLLATLGTTLAAAMLLSTWMASLVSAPIAELAEKTARLDLDRLDQDFSTDRTDEIGALERLLASMTARLRTGAARLRETERVAATGELARQVNHDIKNGLAPIRNVVRHLTQTAEREPDRLTAIFLERRGTLESSVQYLDDLARNYARLSPSLDRTACDPAAVVHEVVKAIAAGGARVDVRMTESLASIRADAVVLRRILENLVSNAVDSLDGRDGRVTLTAELADQGADRRVRFTVADTGRGMSKEELDRAFDDFYTTKPAGTGLGLSVVRRLLMDLGGSIKVDTAPGAGSTFTVEIPAA